MNKQARRQTPTSLNDFVCVRPERVAEVTDMSRTTIYKLMASGELASVKIGASRRVPMDAVRDLMHRLQSGGRVA